MYHRVKSYQINTRINAVHKNSFFFIPSKIYQTTSHIQNVLFTLHLLVLMCIKLITHPLQKDNTAL